VQVIREMSEYALNHPLQLHLVVRGLSPFWKGSSYEGAHMKTAKVNISVKAVH
jgi:hypothetical protein